MGVFICFRKKKKKKSHRIRFKKASVKCLQTFQPFSSSFLGSKFWSEASLNPSLNWCPQPVRCVCKTTIEDKLSDERPVVRSRQMSVIIVIVIIIVTHCPLLVTCCQRQTLLPDGQPTIEAKLQEVAQASLQQQKPSP